jgi:tripartite-type tricarboxylate transporter receptor subunit TctC
VIENRPGAGSNIAAEAATNASPDGYLKMKVRVQTIMVEKRDDPLLNVEEHTEE